MKGKEKSGGDLRKEMRNVGQFGEQENEFIMGGIVGLFGFYECLFEIYGYKYK